MTLKMRYMRLQTCMRLFDAWRVAQKDVTFGRTELEFDDEATIDAIKRSAIHDRLQRMRPEHSYPEIAASLGITTKTLYVYRKELGLV